MEEMNQPNNITHNVVFMNLKKSELRTSVMWGLT